MSNERGRADANNCFVCSPNNPIGLKAEFRIDNSMCRGEFTPSKDHVGYDDVTHGGILFSLLDDVMANWLFLQGARATTARSEIRFRAAHPPGKLLRLEARVSKMKSRLVVMDSKAIDDTTNKIVAEAQASFMVTVWGSIQREMVAGE